MALDVFHQVLAKLLEAAGGDPRQMVPFVEVLKQEKLFGSVDTITTRLQSEGWIADAPKKDHVFVTTWGVEELRRTNAATTPAAAKQAEPKNAAALRAAAEKARALAATLEELAASTDGSAAQRKAKARKALAAATEAVEEAFG
ncbi:MAG: hypothetical protein ACYDBY_11010 [Thermoanaerobaculia bacterium]